jgi:putative two-component system response regulator
VRVLAEGLGRGADYCETLELLAGAHDIGKVGVPDRVLLKPGKLTGPEQAEVRAHATIGLIAIDNMLLDHGLSDYEHAPTLRAIVRSHHERWDGRGYPDGLARDAIPFEARIVCLADVWDALTEFRLYRPVWSHMKARSYIMRAAGRQFDPAIVKVFVRQYPRFLDLFREFRAIAEGPLRVD